MGTSLQRTMALIPQGSLEGYIQAVNSIPVLSAEEERELAMRLQQDGDLEAARQLVMSHLALCRSRGQELLRLWSASGPIWCRKATSA